MDDRRRSGAVGSVGSQDLSGVADGSISVRVSVGTSHEGGGSSDDSSRTHFDRWIGLLFLGIEWGWRE